MRASSRKIVPGNISIRVLSCYSEVLNSPRFLVMESTIIQCLTWPYMKANVEIWVKTLPKCQKLRKQPTGLMKLFPSMNLNYLHGAPLMLN